jgi:DNA-binding GntR family transcriptional regulator
MIKLLGHQNISDKAYNVLLEMIIGGQLESGERLIEEQLAENLGVSRTPLRDAINRLAKDGLVSIQPRKGASVQKFSIDDVMEVYDIRIALEGLAAGLAAAKIDLSKLEKLKMLFTSRNTKDLIKGDTQLHDLIISSCGNKRLINMLNGLKNFIQIFRVSGYTFKDRSMVATMEHIKILESLEKRDRKLSEKLMRKHIEKTQKSVLENFIVKETI